MPDNLIFYILGTLLLILTLAYVCFHKHVNLFIVSITGKKRVQKKIYKACKANDFLIINDIWLPVEENKVKHIDTIIFGNKYIYITSIVKQAGDVKVSLTDQKWRVIYDNELALIDNPFIYNQKIMKKLANVVEGLEISDMKSLVILTKTCRIDGTSSSNQEYVALENDAVNLICQLEENSTEDIFDPFEIERYAKAFYKYGLECEKQLKSK